MVKIPLITFSAVVDILDTCNILSIPPYRVTFLVLYILSQIILTYLRINECTDFP